MQVTEEAAVARPTQVCQTCRIRHRKCDFQEDGCQQCKDAGIACVRQPSLKFRYHPMQTALSRASSGLWRPCPLPRAPAQFHDETPEVRAMYREEESPPPRPKRSLPFSFSQASPGQNMSAESVSGDSICSSHVVSRGPEDSMALDYQMDDTSPLSERLIEEPSPLSDHLMDSCSPLTPIEALLVRNFTDHMAQWTDIADPFRTFETVVSRLAFTDLIVRNAICAFSARHFYRCQDDEDGDGKALDYQNRCLQLLIPSMSGGQEITESILTAVALLRQNEEMDEQDNRFHLEGTSRILNMVPEFSTMGGVGEAACWLCLREDIYISLTRQTPIKTRLDCFAESVSIRRNDDYSWASRSILNLAFLLTRAFREPRNPAHIALSEAELADWDKSKPSSYQPVYVQARSRQENRCFPEVWMLLPYHAVGLQYYHIAQIVLSAVGPRNVLHTHEYLAESRATARRIRHHLFIVLGIAISNVRAENTWFTARHCLAVWGAYLHHPADQMAALDFLENWRRRSGWKTSVLVESLQRQWRENIEDD
ncbi:zn 2cys6 transcription factor [Seiridium cupressi]